MAIKTRATVIAEFKDGTAAYLIHRETKGPDGQMRKFTKLRRWAFKGTPEEAEETCSRLNGVAALGQCWRDVSYFRWAMTK